MQIKRVIVTHRYGVDINETPEHFVNEEDANNYIRSCLAGEITLYMSGEDSCDVDADVRDEYNELNHDDVDAVIQFGYDNGMIIGNAFAVGPDWSEYAKHTISISLTNEEIQMARL